MRIAYLVHFRGGRESGIHRKVAEHASEWSARGSTVGLFVGTGAGAVDDWRALPGAEEVVALPTHPAMTIMARESLLRSIRRWRPDVVYARHGLVHPGLLWTAMRVPTILEINSNDVTEFAAVSPWRSRYSRATRGLLLRYAAGLVFVNGEVARSPQFRGSSPARVVIGNGIRLADYPPFPAPANDVPRVVFIGHADTLWHGLQHLVEMAHAFPDWRFDVIGPGEAELADPPANVALHGTLPPDAYEPIIARADVAVGTLGLYHNRMEETTALKVREYLARGIPTIIGHRDTDFPDPPDFLLRIPNEPTGVMSSLAQIADFMAQSGNLRVPPEALSHLDVGVKEAERLVFIERVARRT